MAITIYDEPWNPSNINCNWKPEKLARYSFVTNMIDFYATGVQLGYRQSGAIPEEDFAMNLTDYIEVENNHNYFIKYESNLELGVRFICFFNSDEEFLDNLTIKSGNNTLEMEFITPPNCSYIRITMFVQAWGKCSLRVSSSDSLISGYKDSTPLNIIDNKVDTQIYKDTHFEVYVKAEALIKNFVDSFDLSAFQAFPDSGDSSYYSPTNSLLFAVSNPSYYLEGFTYEDFIEDHLYKEGDRMKYDNIYCIHKSSQHTSAANFTAEMQINGAYWLLPPNSGNWLKVNQNIKEINYNENLGFPYVGYLLFKNLWGCNMTNYLETFVNKAYLTLTYKKFFAKNLRINEISYDKFFDQGYFDNAANYSSVEGFGVRLTRGEDFRNDEILGDFITNNYVTYKEEKHEIDENWEAVDDDINSSLFGGSLTKPFDHYYKFLPETGVPFFKEKTFNDFKVECTLQKEDILGNIFKRVIKLPIYVKFHNNLIKCYFRNNHSDNLGKYYDAEYLNSHQENYYSVTKGEGDVVSRVTIWCPNVNKLSVSSRIVGPLSYPAAPAIISKNGQICILKWTFSNTPTSGVVMKAIHTLEYSDGENYDKFTYIEIIETV